MPYKRARIEIPNDGDAVAHQIGAGGVVRTPIRSKRREFAHDERFDKRLAGFLIVVIRTDVADVRIRERDDLAAIAGIGENFLVTSEAGIKNDLAATAGASARRAAVKDSPVLEREYRADCGGLVQCVLPKKSFGCRVDGRR
jgi:hypothetical protein